MARVGLSGLLATLLTTLAMAAAPSPGDTILLLSARSFDHSTRVAEVLQDMADATDVFGVAHFKVLRAQGVESFADALRAHADLRAVIALVGDLSLMPGITPEVWPQPDAPLTRRVIDRSALAADLLQLRASAATRGVPLILATAPLGFQGRLEVPELVAWHAHLRNQGPVLDLADHFRRLKSAPLFANGIDVLDEFGHEELARLLYSALLDGRLKLPARDAAEETARVEARALQAIFLGDIERWPDLIDAALETAPSSHRQAARQAALVSLRDGIPAAVERWVGIGKMAWESGSRHELAGLSIGLSLASKLTEVEFPVAPPGDAVERGALRVLQALGEGQADAAQTDDAAQRALAMAEKLNHARPDRLETWLVLQVASIEPLPSRDLRSETRDGLAYFPRSAVSLRTVDAVLARWPNAVDALPALFAASRPYALLRPTGPLLEDARRRNALGLSTFAARHLKRGMDGGRFPTTWRMELARMRDL